MRTINSRVCSYELTVPCASVRDRTTGGTNRQTKHAQPQSFPNYGMTIVGVDMKIYCSNNINDTLHGPIYLDLLVLAAPSEPQKATRTPVTPTCPPPYPCARDNRVEALVDPTAHRQRRRQQEPWRRSPDHKHLRQSHGSSSPRTQIGRWYRRPGPLVEVGVTKPHGRRRWREG